MSLEIPFHSLLGITSVLGLPPLCLGFQSLLPPSCHKTPIMRGVTRRGKHSFFCSKPSFPTYKGGVHLHLTSLTIQPPVSNNLTIRNTKPLSPCSRLPFYYKYGPSTSQRVNPSDQWITSSFPSIPFILSLIHSTPYLNFSSRPPLLKINLVKICDC